MVSDISTITEIFETESCLIIQIFLEHFFVYDWLKTKYNL